MAEAAKAEESEPIKCTVISCPYFVDKTLNPSNRELQFFAFPKNRQITTIWKEKCGVAADHEVRNARVCSDHFRPTDFANARKTTLKKDAVPRENLGWMFGMPEVKSNNKATTSLVTETQVDKAITSEGPAPQLEQIKEAVDMNERLQKRMERLKKEDKALKEKIYLYEKKINNVNKEIGRLKGLIEKMPKKKNGKFEANLICKVFSQAQINMLLGKKVVWSYDDMAMAFTLRHIGNRECYLYLKDTLNMPLPALSCVQRWVASNRP